MNSQQLYDILPLILLAVSPVFLLMVIAIKRNHKLTYSLSVISVMTFIAASFYKFFNFTGPKLIGELIIIDKFSLFYFTLIGISALCILILAYHRLNNYSKNKEEFYVLFLVSLLGSGIMLSSLHFVSFFLGLEILSVSLYPLIAYVKNELGIEAGIKYLILAAASSAFLLFGIGLLYIDLGTMHFPTLGVEMTNGSELSFIGLSLIIAAAGFKLAVVPFHLWTPDVYQGAPSPVSALIATISKGSVIVFVIRFVEITQSFQWDWLITAWTIIALASMLFGNILALRQSNLKRLLAYSSIAHLGYLLVAVMAGKQGLQATTFYLAAYFATIITAFGITGLMSDNDQVEINDLRGLFWKQPKISLLLTLALLSLAGIPLTAGFMGKYYLLRAGVSGELWLLVIVLVISSIIGLFYYLRVIMKMLQQPEIEKEFKLNSGYAVVGILAIILLILGIYPTDLISLIQSLKAF